MGGRRRGRGREAAGLRVVGCGSWCDEWPGVDGFCAKTSLQLEDVDGGTHKGQGLVSQE